MSPTSRTVQYSPIAIAQSNKFLNQLPLFQFFDKLISIPTTPNKKHDECEKLNGYNELQKICNRLGNILYIINEIDIIIDAYNNKDMYCQYLNYFIQEEVENVKSDSDKLPSLYEALKQLKSSYENYECNFEQNTNSDDDIAKISKKLYYYAEYLYWIKQKYNNIINSNESDYYKFLNECVFYYNKLLRHDTCNKTEKYQSELQKFKEHYDEAVVHIKIKCPEIKPKPMENEEEAKESCPNDLDKSQDGYEKRFELLSSIISNIGKRPISQPPPPASASISSDDILQDSMTQDSQGPSIGKATPILCSAVAISMFSFILHKFTPLGTYLRRNKLIDRNRMKGKQDDIYKLLSDASQIPHNITYQPIRY